MSGTSTTDLVRALGGAKGLRLVIVVLALLAVTALASREPLHIPGRAHGAPGRGVQISVSRWELGLIGGCAAIALTGVALYAGLKSGGPIRRRVSPRMGSCLLSLALVLVPLLLGGLLLGAVLTGSHRRAVAPRPGLPTNGSLPPGSPGSPSVTVASWLPWAILGAILAGALVVVVGARKRTSRVRQETLAADVRPAIAAALLDLDSVTDPRLAIIAAYQRMEDDLAAAGLARGPAEAPREYLRRVAGALEIDPAPFGTLTALFEAARFSVRQFDTDGRQRAMRALRAVQAQLA